jgi:protein-S-isoprenylcysteine O-methyltransferase Ste14
VSIFGIGPLLALTGAMSMLLVFTLRRVTGWSLALGDAYRPFLLAAGLILGTIGAYMWLSSVLLIRRAHKSHELLTSGVYGWSRNPMYSAFIVFLIPAAAFIMNDLLILIVSLVMTIVFKIAIRKEEDYLSKEYGAEYQRYAKRVPQLVPFVRNR